MIKRTFDLLVAVCATVIVSPILVLVAILIKIDSRGPALYRGFRVGQHGREFRLYRFRTMIRSAYKQGPPTTVLGDPRITRVGRFLRRWKLDELPQLINVIRGDVSLVGPAAVDATLIALYSAEQMEILRFRPGITSPAAIVQTREGRSIDCGLFSSTYLRTVLPEQLTTDLTYSQSATFWSDLAILARAIASTVTVDWPRWRTKNALVRGKVRWPLIDAAIVVIGFHTALLIRFLDDLPRGLLTYVPVLPVFLIPVIAVYAGVNGLWGLHRRVWRYASAPEVVTICRAGGVSAFLVCLGDFAAGFARGRPLPMSVVVLGGFFTMAGMVLARYRWRLFSGAWANRTRRNWRATTRCLIYGAGDRGQLLAQRLLADAGNAQHQVIGFIDDDTTKRGWRIHNIPVLGTGGDLERIVDVKGIDRVILAMSSIGGERLREIIGSAQRTPAQIKIVPNWLESIATSRPAPLIREVKVEDLLGRQRVNVDVAGCAGALNGKAVLVTGGAGSVGSELCRQILRFTPRRLLILDNNESALHDLEIELRAIHPDVDIASLIGDVTDQRKVDMLFRETRPQVIFHAAAYKHVPLMERYPEEAVRVNVGGTLTILDNAQRYQAERLVLVSTDKAVNAESVMGATKRLAELLVLDASRTDEREVEGRRAPLLCTAVRFGNVLGSRGSVVPTFAKQIEMGGPVTVTHPEMTRYFMEISEAAALIIQASALTEGGELFMLDMGNRIRVDDLARKMIRFRGLRPEKDVRIVYVGIRPGEKLHEELTFDEEERANTAHPLIYRIVGKRLASAAGITEAAQMLLEIAVNRSRTELVDCLMDLSRPGADGAPKWVAVKQAHGAHSNGWLSPVTEGLTADQRAAEAARG